MSIGMRSVYWVDVLRLIPTADHLDRAKLGAVLGWFDPEDLSHLKPLEIASDADLNLYLLDGHCRAWALWATGVDKAPAVVKDTFPQKRAAFPLRDISSLPIL